MIRLEGKKTLITGGSRGIGRAAAELFARAGSDIAVNFLCRREEGEKIRRAVESLGKECLLLKADVSVNSDVQEMVKEIIQKWRQIDILVNNAGV